MDPQDGKGKRVDLHTKSAVCGLGQEENQLLIVIISRKIS